MDLRKKGIFFILEKGMNVKPFLKKEYLARGSYSKSRGIFEFPSGIYDVGIETGAGGYGNVLLGTSQADNSVYAIKVLDIENFSTNESEFVYLAITQALINIVLEEESKDQLEGPFVPEFYEIAYDDTRKYILLRMKALNDTLYFRFNASSIKENDSIVPRTLAHVAHIMDFFQKRLKFNHRDLKPNNIMYSLTPTGQFQIRLIDFGWSCLNYYGTEIKGREYFDDTHNCNLQSRDLTFLIWCIYNWHQKQLSAYLKKLMEYLLTFNADQQTCRLYLGCYAYKMTTYDRDTLYTFMNNPKIKNPKGIPHIVRTFMMNILGITDSKQKSPIHSIMAKRIHGLPYCAATKILNPKTRKCVGRGSLTGRNIIRISKRISSPSTHSKTRKHTATLKPCKSHQYRDPFTRRCKKRPN